MSYYTPTPQELLNIEALKAKQQQEHDAYMACPKCKAVMEYVATLSNGNEQGYGAEYLVQCSNCKTIAVRDRT